MNLFNPSHKLCLCFWSVLPKKARNNGKIKIKWKTKFIIDC